MQNFLLDNSEKLKILGKIVWFENRPVTMFDLDTYVFE